MEQIRVGVVGLGKMGSAFARRLLNKGYSVCVWDRSPQRVQTFDAPGAMPYTLLGDMLKAVDCVLVMLWGDEVAREVSLAQIVPELQPGKVLIESSTLSPQMYETLEQAAHERKVDFVAAPVLGNPNAVREGTLTVLPGGAAQAVQRVRPVLAALGTVIEMPSVRASSYLKLANNTILGVVAETLGELLELCERAGVEQELAVRSLTGAFQRSAQQKVPQLLADDTEPRFSLSALVKDLYLSQAAAKSLQRSVPVLDAVLPQAQRAVERGLGDRDYIVLALDRPGEQAGGSAS